MRPGEGDHGSAAERAPVMIASEAHLDPRFKSFPNLPEDQYEPILAVPIVARDDGFEGALNVCTLRPRTFTDAEIDLLSRSRRRSRSRSSTRSCTRRRSTAQQ